MAEERSGAGAGTAVAGAGLGLAALLRVCATGADDVVRVGALSADDLARAGGGVADDLGRAGGLGGAELGLGDDAIRGPGLASLADDGLPPGSVAELGAGEPAAVEVVVATADTPAPKPGSLRVEVDDVLGHGVDLGELLVEAGVPPAPEDDAGRWIGQPRDVSTLRHQLRVTRAGQVLGFVVRAEGDRYRLLHETVDAREVARLCQQAQRTCWVYILPDDAPWRVANDAWDRSGERPEPPELGSVRTF